MTTQHSLNCRIFGVSFLIAILSAVLLVSLTGNAQTFTVLHAFTGAGDGFYPRGVTIDQAGNLYGATLFGGSHSQGTVFKMANKTSGWTLTPLYNFAGGNNGGDDGPLGVVLGPDGRLYGTTTYGGTAAFGTVFSLSPPASFCGTVLCEWTETTLHNFTDVNDGAYPWNSDLVFDSAGNIYGTTAAGGDGNCYEYGCGTVYELSRSGSEWNISLLYQFQPSGDYGPGGGVALDNSGNLYGTASSGGSQGGGTVYQLVHSDGSWSKNTLFSFPLLVPTYGAGPEASPFVDSSGNVYGTTTMGGSGNGGTAYELTHSGGNWEISLLYNFVFRFSGDPIGPTAPLTRDAAGNFYGATVDDGAHGCGNVFKLTYENGGWTYSSLYDFTCGSDGNSPSSRILVDSHGNLYGSTAYGGTQNSTCSNGCGVVFEITP